MKKILSVMLVLLVAFSIITACSKKASLKDGTYTAEEAAFGETGWKDNLTIEIKDGKIAEVDWNSTHEDGGKQKKEAAIDGEYGMIVASPIGKEWHEQAEAAEKFLIEKQDVNAIVLNDEGQTDSISGCTMDVDGFVAMANDILEQAGK